jgi:hypothetical protein
MKYMSLMRENLNISEIKLPVLIFSQTIFIARACLWTQSSCSSHSFESTPRSMS